MIVGNIYGVRSGEEVIPCRVVRLLDANLKEGERPLIKLVRASDGGGYYLKYEDELISIPLPDPEPEV